MDDFIEVPAVVLVLALDVEKDETGTDVALLTVVLEGDMIARVPMSVEVAMRVWGLLDKARQDNGWSEPTMPISADEMP